MGRPRIGVVAFGFGEPASANPNPRIGECASKLASKKDVGVIVTDRDVFPHLSCGEIKVVQIDPSRVPTTYRLAGRAVKEAMKQRLATLHVVAAPCHMWRCLRDLGWAVQDQGSVLKLVAQPIEGYQYGLDATTPYTRSAWIWWPFEIAYRVVSSIFPRWYKSTRS